MGIPIGTAFRGKVSAVGGESIQTKFVILGGPFAPLESMYVLEEATFGVRGFPIELQRVSVIAGFLRSWLFLGSFVGLLLGYFLEESTLLILGILSTVALIPAIFVLGRPSAVERQQREILRSETGLAAPPELVPVHMAEEIFSKLKKRWAALKREAGVKGWRPLFDGELGHRAQPLAFALSQYGERVGDSRWVDAGREAWHRLK